MLTFKCRTEGSPRNVDDYQSTRCDIPGERRPPSGHFASVCTQTLSWQWIIIRMEIKFSLWDYISQTLLLSKIPVLSIMMKRRLSSYSSLTWRVSAMKTGCRAMLCFSTYFLPLSGNHYHVVIFHVFRVWNCKMWHAAKLNIYLDVFYREKKTILNHVGSLQGYIRKMQFQTRYVIVQNE